MMLKRFRKKYKTTIEQPNRIDSVIPSHYQLMIKTLLHVKQQELFDDILVISLCYLYKHYNQRHIESIPGSVFEHCLKQICKNLITLNSLLNQEGLWETQIARNRALTIMVFYRTMWGCIVQYNIDSKSSELADDREKILLLKRVPPKLFFMLGTDYWRLYEFFAVIFDDLSDLKLNSDIRQLLLEIFGNTKVSNELITSTTLIGENEIVEENNDSLTIVMNSFLNWLKNKISGDDEDYRINESKLVFAQPLKYKNTIFITVDVLQNYVNEHAVDSNKIEEGLLKCGITDNKKYMTECDEINFELIRIHPLVSVIHSTKHIIIREGD